MRVRKGKPGCMIALLVFVLFLFAIRAVVAIKGEQNEKAQAERNAQMSILLEEGYRCGDGADKAIVMICEREDDAAGDFTTTYVPEGYQTEIAAEVRYIIRRVHGSETVGYYNMGGAALKHKYTVEVLDLKTGASETEIFYGGEPPHTVTVKDGKVKSHYGSEPSEEKISQWVISVMQGAAAAQTQASAETTEPAVTEAATESGLTEGQQKALELARENLSYNSGYSPSRLEHDLVEYEGVAPEDAKFAVENCDGDWVQEARECALLYAEYGFSARNTYSTMCMNDGFSEAQARQGVDTCGADWKQAAVNQVQYELENGKGSHDRASMLRDLVEVYWFTEEEANYALDVCGIE